MSENVIDSVVIKKQTLTDIADDIRDKLNISIKMTPTQMSTYIQNMDVTNYPLGAVWVGTQQEYDNLQDKAVNVIYYIIT